MPFAIVIIVGLVFYNSGIRDKVPKPQKELTTEVEVTKSLKVSSKQQEPVKEEINIDVKKPEPISEPIKKVIKIEAEKPEPINEETKIEAEKPEPINEETKIEAEKPEPINEETKIEAEKPEPIKEVIKEELKVDPKESKIESIKVDGSNGGYLKIILYIIGAIVVTFGGFYFFSKRGSSGQLTSRTVESSRRDIEENYEPDQQPVKEEVVSDNTDQQPVKEDDDNKK